MVEKLLSRQICLLADDPEVVQQLAVLARGHGVEFLAVRPTEIESLSSAGGILLLDLDGETAGILRAIECARGSDSTIWYICGYGSRLDFESLSKVRGWGVDRILSRSMIILGLQHVLGEMFGSKSSETS